MIRPSFSQKDIGSGYRDGTVMGLTAAEAFMLISFMLLLLLAWRFIADEKIRIAHEETQGELDVVQRKLEEKQRELEETQGELEQVQNELEDLRKFDDQFSEEQKELVLRYLGRLSVIHESIKIIDYITDTDVTIGQLQKGLDLENRFGRLDPDLMEDRLRLMEREKLRTLLESVQNLPEEELQRLTNMMSTKDLAKRLQKFEAFDESRIDLETVFSQQKKEKQQNKIIADLQSELQAFEQLELTPEEIREMQRQARRIEDLRQGQERSREEIVRQFRQQIGPRIKPLGGEIRDNGNIIFPDRGLFDTGSATIRPDFDQVLQSICRDWFEALHDKQQNLDTMQIEGHASSEYGNKTGRDAFDRNLDLSQERAAAVFKRCLDHGGDDDIAAWAQSNLVAVGFSSARLIKYNGVEDRRTSRRVEFAIGMKPVDNISSSQVLERGFR